jgi:Acetyltransferase (GNAT) family
VLLRPLTVVLALHKNLPEGDRCLRFFTTRPGHLEQLARLLTAAKTGCALGAFDAGRLIGVANYVVSDDPHVADIAVAVAHDEHGASVGTALMRQLGKIAFSRGIHRFTADVLATNDLMREMLSHTRWPHTIHREDAQVLGLEIEVPEPTSTTAKAGGATRAASPPPRHRRDCRW